MHCPQSQTVNGFQSMVFATAKAQLIRITAFFYSMEIQLRERTVQLTLICSSIVLYDQSFPRKYSFPICVCLSQSVPNKPKIRSVVMEVASLE